MKRSKILNKLLLAGAMFLGLFSLTACNHGTLASGGAYAPAPVTNSVTGAVTAVQPDFAFFAVDSAFDLAYSAIDAAFTFERDNRAYLWSLSHDIKHTLDEVRPQAVEVRDGYIKARASYMANPTPTGLSLLQQILAKTQQLATAAQAALPKGQ